MLVVLLACPGEEPEPVDPDFREPCADVDPDRNLYWGDLHVHSVLSFDAVLEGVTTTPEQAYGFARGEPLTVPGDVEVRLERPLDFAAVTDHAEFLGEISLCLDPDGALYDAPWCVELREDGTVGVQRIGTRLSFESPDRFAEICDEADCLAAAGDVWSRVQEAAEQAYDRSAACSFTSFVSYEWSGTPGVSNLHRNVLFRNIHVPDLPISYFEAPEPRRLWRALADQCLDADVGCDVLSIPHNSNLAGGTMFVPDRPTVGAIEEAELRAMVEPLIEVFQHKGDSECLEGLSGILGAPDELCAFEKLQRPPLDDCGEGTGGWAMIGQGCTSRWDYLRGILVEGMKEYEELGVNPYEVGVIASTDTHLGAPGLVDERGWPGHTGNPEDTPEERLAVPELRPGGLLMNPGGLAAIWAESNDRDSLFDAMLRREVYGTSGPRIPVRFFGGWGLPETLCDAADLVARGYAGGVPMGGVLSAKPDAVAAPTFVATALMDPGTEASPGAPLQRIQLVKGWLDADGEGQQRVIDLAGGPNDASVDLSTCTPTGDGASSLCGSWTDDDFDPSLPAFWYLRVLENPTCRWSTWECLSLPQDERPPGCDDDSVAPTIQERAWTSPIFWRG
jgi:hypothetical protein